MCQVGHDVEPGRRHVIGTKVETGALAHRRPSFSTTHGWRAYRDLPRAGYGARRSRPSRRAWEDVDGRATSSGVPCVRRPSRLTLSIDRLEVACLLHIGAARVP